MENDDESSIDDDDDDDVNLEEQLLVESYSNEEEIEEEEEDINYEEIENPTKKRTVSHQCLAQVEISRSSLLLDPFYWFPELEDPHIEELLWSDEPTPNYDQIGVLEYIDVCKEEHIRPFQRIIHNLNNSFLDLRYFGLSEPQMKALCAALSNNTTVRRVLLEENFITEKGLQYINDMLLTNDTIELLDLSRCSISSKASLWFSNGFAFNITLRELNLSYNQIEEGVAYLSHALTRNNRLKSLNLCHNHINDQGLVHLADLIEENYSLNELDLSWNYLFKSEGMKAFMIGLADNLGLRTLNLSWCGIGDVENMVHISRYLKNDTSRIEHLNLSNNRICGKAVNMLRNGLKANESLVSINLAGNPFIPSDVEAIASVVLETREIPFLLRDIDFSGVVVQKNMIMIRSQCRKKGVNVKYERVLSNYKLGEPDFDRIIMSRAKYVAMNQKKKKFKQDFGTFLLSLPDVDRMTADEFKTAMKKRKIKLDSTLLDYITTTYVSKPSGEINPKLLKEIYLKYFPDTEPPVKIMKKQRKAKKKRKHKPSRILGEFEFGEFEYEELPGAYKPYTFDDEYPLVVDEYELEEEEEEEEDEVTEEFTEIEEEYSLEEEQPLIITESAQTFTVYNKSSKTKFSILRNEKSKSKSTSKAVLFS